MTATQIPKEILEEEKESLLEIHRKMYEFTTEKGTGIPDNDETPDNLIMAAAWAFMKLIEEKYPPATENGDEPECYK